MALNLQSLDARSAAYHQTCRWQDVVLYALGVGAKAEELEFLFEKFGPKVLPTYLVSLGYEACWSLFDVIGGDFKGVVHSSQRIQVHRLPRVGETLSTDARVSGLYDLKRMAIATVMTETRDAEGGLLAENEWSFIYRFDGGFGGPPPPRAPRLHYPERAPELHFEDSVSPEQALLFRLSGDLNPLHADPELAKSVGFDRPILHGLSTYGFLDRALVQKLCAGDPSRLKTLHVQFRKPVFPGETLVSEGWVEGDRVLLRMQTKERPGDFVVDQSYAEITG